MKIYTFSDASVFIEKGLGALINNKIDEKIARHAPDHFYKLTEEATKDTRRENYDGELFGGVRRYMDVKKKKRALKNLSNYLNKDRLRSRGVTFLDSDIGNVIDKMALNQLRSSINKAYRKAGKDD